VAEAGARLPFFVIGDPDHLGHLGVPVRTIAAPSEAAHVALSALPVLSHPFPAPAVPGRPDPANAEAVIAVIARAVDLVMRGEAAALTTGPIHKKALIDGAGFAWPGHTEYLAHLAGVDRVVMMLAGPDLRVVPTTIHIALKDVPGTLDAAAPVRHDPHHRRRAAPRFRRREAPHRRGGAEPPCRRRRRHGPRGDRDHRPRDRRAARRGLRPSPARIPPTRCSTPPRAPATTRRSRCITTRR
jgi:hypothetical protein